MSIVALPHGVHRDVSEWLYHGRVLGVASKHALDLVQRSPAHYRAYLDSVERPDTPARMIGKAFHCATLEPERFADTYSFAPDFGDCRYKEAKAVRDAWRKENEGRLILESSDHAACLGMSESIRRHPLAGKLLEGGIPEATVRWKDTGTGLECKGRPDYYVPERRLIVDLKTTENASPEAFEKDAARYRYHRQDAFYRDGLAAIGQPVDHFVFLVVEKTAPFAVGIYTLDEDSVNRGRSSIRADLERLAECVEHDDWPAYSDSIVTLRLPGWAA